MDLWYVFFDGDVGCGKLLKEAGKMEKSWYMLDVQCRAGGINDWGSIGWWSSDASSSV